MKKIYLIILGVLIQLSILFVIIGKYQYVLSTGQTIIVKTRGYDPRDLFRGDYVNIGYDNSVEHFIGDNYDKEICSGYSYYNDERPLYIIPKLSGDYFISIEEVKLEKPSGLFFKASLSYCNNSYYGGEKTVYSGDFYIRYPADKLFIKEKSGGELEKKLRDRNVDTYAVWKVGNGGEIVLSHLLIDGIEVR